MQTLMIPDDAFCKVTVYHALGWPECAAIIAFFALFFGVIAVWAWSVSKI